MGCTASKLEYEDTVRRCKDRRRLMKEALYAHHHLAPAHSNYWRSLRLTGSALCTFAAGEPLSVSDNTPAVFLPITTTIHHPPQPQPPSHIPSPSPSSVHPPSPPPFNPCPSSSINSTTNLHHQRRRKQPPPKLPHILSDSSPSSNPRSHSSNNIASKPPSQTTAHSTYSSTPSQNTSDWSWENHPPPPPPDVKGIDSERSECDYFNRKLVLDQKNKGHYLEEYTETESEEVECSDRGDYYSTTTSSDEDGDDDGVEGDVESRSEIGTSSNFGSAAAAAVGKSEDAASSSTGEGGMEVRHGDLKEIAYAIKENFDKAAVAGDQVSEMLEINKAQRDRSFRQLRKTVLYRLSSLLNSLSSTRTSKPPLAVKYRLDTGSLDEPGSLNSLCSTLERLLALEKKLYEEVKTREGVKIEYEKKLLALRSREDKGEDEAKIFKTKASVNRLQSQLVVTSQAVSTTSTTITGLRDSDLVPQLRELCHGMMCMWRSMHQYHEIQRNIVQQVRGLVNRSSGGDSTSELHRQATWDLESAVSVWHSSFTRLIKFQRDFILSLHGWFKLSLIPVDNDNINYNNNREPSDADDVFFDDWKHALDRVPGTDASEAIKSFINVIQVISSKQAEELKIKKRTETASKELGKKASSVRNKERKFYDSYSMVGISLPDTAPDNGQGLDARDPLAEEKLELAACQRRVEEEMLRHSKAVEETTRAMTLNNLQTGLPEVFQALTSFSSQFTEALGLVHAQERSQNFGLGGA